MTSALATVPGAAVGQPPNDFASRRPRLLVPLAVVLPPAGAVLILLALHHAAGLAEPDHAQFALFWAGFLCGMLPLVALACSTGINGVTRTCALTGIGLFGTVPRLLRIPAGPRAHGERRVCPHAAGPRDILARRRRTRLAAAIDQSAFPRPPPDGQRICPADGIAAVAARAYRRRPGTCPVRPGRLPARTGGWRVC